MLEGQVFRRLILLGDIFSDLNFRRLKKEHWQFLGYIRKLSNPKRGVEVVWVEGNHDLGLTDVMSHLVGVKVYQEYTWDYDGKKHLAVHGHQFDRFIVNNILLSHVGTFLHLTKQDVVNDKAVKLVPMHCQMLLPVVIPRVFLINLHADQMRHHIGQAEVVVPFHPNHFHAAFGIGKLPNIPEKLPMFFLQPSEIEIGKDITQQDQPPKD